MKTFSNKERRGLRLSLTVLLPVMCCALILLWLLSWVDYTFIGWTSGHLQPVGPQGPQQVVWNQRHEWGLFVFEGVAAIGWQEREAEVGTVSGWSTSAESVALRKGRPWCFFFPVSPIVWDRGTWAWPQMAADVSAHAVQVSPKSRWAYRRVLFPLWVPTWLLALISSIAWYKAGRGKTGRGFPVEPLASRRENDGGGTEATNAEIRNQNDE